MFGEQEEEFEKLKYNYSTSDRAIKELQDQVMATSHSLEISKQN